MGATAHHDSKHPHHHAPHPSSGSHGPPTCYYYCHSCAQAKKSEVSLPLSQGGDCWLSWGKTLASSFSIWDLGMGSPQWGTGTRQDPTVGNSLASPPVGQMWFLAPSTPDPSETAINPSTFYRGLGPGWDPGAGKSSGQDPASTQAL